MKPAELPLSLESKSPAAVRRRNLALRTATAAVGLPLLVLIVWAGAPWFSLLVAAASAIAALEVCSMARHRGDRPVTIVAVALAVGLIASAHFLAGDPSEYLFVLFVYVGTLFSLQWLFRSPQSFPGSLSWTATLGAAYYPAGLLFQAPLLRAGEQGREWTLYLLLVSFAADTCAFFVGRAIGKRPMAPRVSPSKTWEGAVGGFLGALAASFAAFYAFALDAEVWRIALMGGLIGVVGQAGGLVNSRLKRKAGVKDSGRLFPGHGGIVDRLDSIVFNLVVVYHFVR